MSFCPACGHRIEPELFDKTDDFYIRCPVCNCAIFRENVVEPPEYKYVVELPDGKVEAGNPYDIISNYVADHARKDWDLNFYDDFFVVMSFGKDEPEDYFYDRLYFSTKEVEYFWEHDWHEGEMYVRLVGYAPFNNIADFIAKGIIFKKG